MSTSISYILSKLNITFKEFCSFAHSLELLHISLPSCIKIASDFFSRLFSLSDILICSIKLSPKLSEFREELVIKIITVIINYQST